MILYHNGETNSKENLQVNEKWTPRYFSSIITNQYVKSKPWLQFQVFKFAKRVKNT